MATSPSPLNYFLGKGIVKWQPTAGGGFRDLGNTPMFETTPVPTRLPHYNSRQGVQRLDENPVSRVTMTCKFHLEEITPENLALALLGSQQAGPPITVNVMDIGVVSGWLRMIGTNNVGDMKQVDLPSVTLAPSAGFQWISEAWGLLEITAEVLASAVTPGPGGLTMMTVGSFGVITNGITGEVAY